MIRVKRRLYRTAKRTGKEEHIRKYKSVSNTVRKQTRKEHQVHLNDICNHLHTDQRGFWMWLKTILNQQTTIPPLTIVGKTLTSAVDKANALNQYFSSVFTKENWQNLESLKMSLSASRQTISMEQITIVEEDVYKLLSDVDPTKASGPDEIPGRLLKEGAMQIAVPLTRLFNISLRTGTLPDDWKKANITPIHKKGDKHTPKNYRPISLTSLVVKVLEHILHNSIMDFVEMNNILNNNQHGFRKRHSCQTQLLRAVND